MIKNMLNYYSRMITSINTHTKNILKNTTTFKEEVSKEILNINEEVKKLSSIVDNFSVDISDMEIAIVTVSYNSAKYLNDYFISLIKQNNIDVKRQLKIYFIDDGSEDNTKEEVIYWQNKGLDITYIYQSNQGPGAARNKGLELVKTKWVTFIDSDDFVNDNYFYQLFKYLKNGSSNVYIAPWITYYESNNKKIKDHPLSWRFQKSDLVDIETNSHYINLPINCVTFNNLLINGFEIKFRNIKPNFEDADFYLNYLDKTRTSEVFFISDISYFHRKRLNKDSLIDLSKIDKHRFVENIKEAYIYALQNYLGQHVKLTVLYDLRWNVLELEKNPTILREIDYDMRKEYLRFLFNYITIEDLNYAYKKKLISEKFSNFCKKVYYNISFLEYQYFNRVHNKVVLKVVTHEDDFFNILINKGLSFLSELEYREKVILQTEFGNIKEYLVYCPIEYDYSYLQLEQKTYGLKVENTGYQKKKFNTKSILLFFDRIESADDNAEHLYRWFKNNKPKYKNKYFILKKDTRDWYRLKEEGFNLVEYGSKEFEELYIKGDFIFSSAGDSITIENYRKLRYLSYASNINFIFLQHGITKDDLKEWLISKRYNMMVTVKKKEHNYLLENVLTQDILAQTGFPRYDNLMNLPKTHQKVILSFTWRYELEQKSIIEIKQTTYYKNILRMSQKLQKIDEILLVLHPNMEIMYGEFVEILGEQSVKMAKDISYQQSLASAKVFITDYSSLAFDAAICRKNIIYYQYDKEEFYAAHTYKESKELFDYQIEGYGEIINDLTLIVEKVKNLKNNRYLIEEKYLERIDKLVLEIPKNASKNIFKEMKNRFK